MANVRTAPINGQTAKARRAREKLFVCFRTRPTRYGPRNPPRFPTELIRAIPAAAPAPLRTRDDIAQNGPRLPHMPTAASESAASSAAGAFKNAAKVRTAAPANAAVVT